MRIKLFKKKEAKAKKEKQLPKKLLAYKLLSEVEDVMDEQQNIKGKIVVELENSGDKIFVDKSLKHVVEKSIELEHSEIKKQIKEEIKAEKRHNVLKELKELPGKAFRLLLYDKGGVKASLFGGAAVAFYVAYLLSGPSSDPIVPVFEAMFKILGGVLGGGWLYKIGEELFVEDKDKQ